MASPFLFLMWEFLLEPLAQRYTHAMEADFEEKRIKHDTRFLTRSLSVEFDCMKHLPCFVLLCLAYVTLLDSVLDFCSYFLAIAFLLDLRSSFFFLFFFLFLSRKV